MPLHPPNLFCNWLGEPQFNKTQLLSVLPLVPFLPPLSFRSAGAGSAAPPSRTKSTSAEWFLERKDTPGCSSPHSRCSREALLHFTRAALPSIAERQHLNGASPASLSGVLRVSSGILSILAAVSRRLTLPIY